LQRDRGKNNNVLILNTSNTKTKILLIILILITTITRDESGLGVFADDGAFALGSRRYIEEEAWTLYEPCVNNDCGGDEQLDGCGVLWGSPVVNVRGFLPDEATPPNQDGGRRGASRE
jgi:hypothetical protein